MNNIIHCFKFLNFVTETLLLLVPLPDVFDVAVLPSALLQLDRPVAHVFSLHLPDRSNEVFGIFHADESVAKKIE